MRGQIVMRINAVQTAYAMFKTGTLLVFLRQRCAAGMALVIGARCKPVFDRHALIENKALTAPCTVFCGHGFQIFQNTAFEMKHIFIAARAQIGGGFFAADTAGTKHGDIFRALFSGKSAM